MPLWFAVDPCPLGSGDITCAFLPKDQFHKMVELTVAARQAYKTMLENVRQELAGEPHPQTSVELPAQGPSCSAEDSSPAPSKTEEPHYSEYQGGSESGLSVVQVKSLWTLIKK